MSERMFDNLMDDVSEDAEIDPEVFLQQLLNDTSLVQHIIRNETDGCQTIVGYFRVAFQPGQQRHILHIPFSPPLSVIPQVVAHATDDEDVRVRITDCQQYGIRVEVVLSNVAESDRRLLIEIIATEAN